MFDAKYNDLLDSTTLRLGLTVTVFTAWLVAAVVLLRF